MVTMTLSDGDLIVRPGPFTRAERDALPDDGYRHELLDGVLVMSPAPNPRHQGVVGTLYVLLRAAAPAHLRVLLSPTDVVLGEATVLEPDIVVARRADVTEQNLPAAPMLAVEVLSPSTRLFDLGRKKEILEAAGCPSYWVVDPRTPELAAWELREGRYVEVARVAGGEPWTARLPYPLTLVPNELLDD